MILLFFAYLEKDFVLLIPSNQFYFGALFEETVWSR